MNQHGGYSSLCSFGIARDNVLNFIAVEYQN